MDNKYKPLSFIDTYNCSQEDTDRCMQNLSIVEGDRSSNENYTYESENSTEIAVVTKEDSFDVSKVTKLIITSLIQGVFCGIGEGLARIMICKAFNIPLDMAYNLTKYAKSESTPGNSKPKKFFKFLFF